MQNLYIARQPIYNQQLELFGYELLYRARMIDRAEVEDDDEASIKVLTMGFLEVGMDDLVGSARAFINIPRRFLADETLTPMFEGNVVLEVLESVKPDDRTLSGIMRLKQQGYAIAMDDFVYDPAFDTILEYVDYVKIDVREYSLQELTRTVQALRRFPCKLLAEKVETHQVFEDCKRLGFDYYQGYFLRRPETLKHGVNPANKIVVLEMLRMLQQADLNLRELEEILARDPALSYKLLRYINSAAYSRRREISSIKDAILLIGLDTIRNWASMVLISSVARDKPFELVITAMVRAKMCELVVGQDKSDARSRMFLIGLFSILDALLDTPMEELLDNVTLSAPIKLALLDHAGVEGGILDCVIHYERGEWRAVGDKRSCGASDYPLAYVNAIKWARASFEGLREELRAM